MSVLPLVALMSLVASSSSLLRHAPRSHFPHRLVILVACSSSLLRHPRCLVIFVASSSSLPRHAGRSRFPRHPRCVVMLIVLLSLAILVASLSSSFSCPSSSSLHLTGNGSANGTGYASSGNSIIGEFMVFYASVDVYISTKLFRKPQHSFPMNLCSILCIE
jgi:hypothetical protein